MLSYRHQFHAGNVSDVFKHALLCRLLLALGRKDKPYFVLDTHAGLGLYDLQHDWSEKTGEWRKGIARVFGRSDAPEALRPYLDAVRAENPDGNLRFYPGSPRIAQGLLRRQDRATLCELHPDDARALERNMGRDNRLRILHEDGYRALRGLVPPPERRGLVLIDPPFESRDEFAAMAESLILARRKWETGIFALWYPVKEMRAVSQFVGGLKAEGIPRILRFELCVEAIRTEGPLSATGLIVVNPPYVLEAEGRAILRELSPLLSRGPGAEVFVEQVSGE